MGSSRKTPVIVGVGDAVNRNKKSINAIEPLKLMIRAIESALRDTGLSEKSQSSLQSEIDSVDVVKSWTWPLDYPTHLAEKLKFSPRHKHYSGHGGHQPARLLDEAARRISTGESKVAIVTGGEALGSLSVCVEDNAIPPPKWSKPNEDVRAVFSPTSRALQSDLGAKHSIGNPIHVYPLYENNFRVHRNQTISENHAESAKMYAEFAKVAHEHQYTYNYPTKAETEESIGTISKKNRMICMPYPLLMNAFNKVNLSAACILTTTEHAQELGIPREKWIYPLGGAGTSEPTDFWKRQSFWWSAAISRSIDAALEVSDLDKDDIDLYDLYSCFPIVPKLACHHLSLSPTSPSKPITVLGGLTSFGGAGNSYSMHAITEMTRLLRTNARGRTGLILANGGNLTSQHAICLSRSPRTDGLPYPDANPLPARVEGLRVPKVVERAEGEAIVETYTVEFGRDGNPSKGFVVGRLRDDGSRFLANHGDEGTLRELASWTVEPIGRKGRVWTDGEGRNLFSFGERAKL